VGGGAGKRWKVREDVAIRGVEERGRCVYERGVGGRYDSGGGGGRGGGGR
jgi:hypothetical protein